MKRALRLALLTAGVCLRTGAESTAVFAAISVAPHDVLPEPPAATPAAGMFLVARRGFLDPNFSQTVVFLLQHDREASFGVVVNRPADNVLSDTLPYLADTPFASRPLYRGGPMDPGILVMLIRNAARSEMMRPVSGDIQASVNVLVLDRMLVEHTPPDQVRFYLGYAGWSPGRLEQELQHHYWYLMNGDPDAVFGAEAAGLWDKLIKRLEPAGAAGTRTAPPAVTGHSSPPGPPPALP